MFRRLVLTGVLIVGVVSGFVEHGTAAYFTSAASSSGNQFVTGSVTITASNTAGDSLSVSNLVPSDTLVAQLTVNNSGTLDLRYAMTTNTSGDTALINALLLTVRTKTSNACSSLDGAVLYGPGNLLSGTMGDPTVGTQTGDRTLAAGANERLCFAVSLPTSGSTSLQGLSMTALFSFQAEQQAGIP